jgi:hypothetical protein
VQLSLFSFGAANNADFICMAADGNSFLEEGESFLAEEDASFLESHP